MKRIIRTFAVLILFGTGMGTMLGRRPHLHNTAPKVRQYGYTIDYKAIQRAKTFTVLISNEGFGGISRGTGILVDSAHVLTCAHVIEGITEDAFVYINSGHTYLRGHVVQVSLSKDLAILKLDASVRGLATPIFQEQYQEGQPITIIGNIEGAMQWFVSYGIISGETKRDLLTDGLVLGGDSGGPWINDRGEVVAMSDWGLADGDGHMLGINGGISAATINTFLKQRKQPNVLELLLGNMSHKAPNIRKKMVAR